MDPELIKKKLEYEERKARAKALALRLTCTICGARPRILLNCPCGTTQYCSVECQRIDWRDRGHRKECKKIRNERAAEAARAETPAPPPEEVFYGPAPRSHADEVRARIAAEHEAARALREANPEPEPTSARFGPRCPICLDEWDVNAMDSFLPCCCRTVCQSCVNKLGGMACPLCRTPRNGGIPEFLALIRGHVDNDVPEAINFLAESYRDGDLGLAKSMKKAAKLFKRAVELGSVNAMVSLGYRYFTGKDFKLDEKKALKLWRMAADRGLARAQCNLAVALYERGKPEWYMTREASEDYPRDERACQDLKEAFRYFQLAAEQGFTEAEYRLGMCFGQGDGVEHDIDEAIRWYTRAAAKGDEWAIEMLKSCA